MKRLNNLGDTIVEVLLALLVVSMVLSGAYVTANNSLNNGREAQERGEALKTLESQIERFKTKESTDGIDTNDTTINCIDTSGNIVPAYSPSKSGVMPNNTAALDPFPPTGTYRAACSVKNGGVTFYLSIEHQNFDDRDYVFRARWDNVGGNGRSEAKLIYGSSAVPYVGFTSNCPLWCSISNFNNSRGGGGTPKPPSDSDNFGWSFRNRSFGGARTGCTWNLGDGTILNDVYCDRNDGFSHNYLNDGPNPAAYFPNYPTTWSCQKFTVTLRVFYTFGPPRDFTDNITIPRYQPNGTRC